MVGERLVVGLWDFVQNLRQAIFAADGSGFAGYEVAVLVNMLSIATDSR